MSEPEVSSDEDIGEIRSEDEGDVQVVQEPGEGEDVQQTENAEEETAAGDVDEALKQETKVKRVVNPQPKLNADRLKGPRGIQTVEGILSKIKFKGRGHEEADLNSLMQGYEYWCHRLFPKYTFDDCLEKIERLGAKREIQTHIKKIRMNLLFSDDVSGTTPIDDENETEQNEVENVAVEDDPFNALLSSDNENPIVRQDLAPLQVEPPKLSEEQLERMRINRERAKRIRIQKMISMRGATQAEPSSSQQPFSGSLSQSDTFNGTNLSNPPNDFQPMLGDSTMSNEVEMVGNEGSSLPVNDSPSIAEIIA